MKQHPHHFHILESIKELSGVPTQHTALDNYLGTTHKRHEINMPTMRIISRAWTKENRDMSATDFRNLLTSLINGDSFSEKIMAGILLNSATKAQRKFDPKIFDQWLDHVEGWAEVDTLCSGAYTVSEIPAEWSSWKKLLIKFSKSKNIHKRRASIVMLVMPVRKVKDKDLLAVMFENIERLKSEKEILITKAISWVLRSAVNYHAAEIKKYITLNKDSLPKIAVRETMTKLDTGRKTKAKA